MDDYVSIIILSISTQIGINYPLYLSNIVIEYCSHKIIVFSSTPLFNFTIWIPLHSVVKILIMILTLSKCEKHYLSSCWQLQLRLWWSSHFRKHWTFCLILLINSFRERGLSQLRIYSWRISFKVVSGTWLNIKTKLSIEIWEKFSPSLFLYVFWWNVVTFLATYSYFFLKN